MVRIEHIALWSDDIEALKTFYQRYFGATSTTKYTNEKKRFSSYFLSFESGARIELMQRPDVRQTEEPMFGYAHIAVSLGSEAAVDKLTDTLRNDGIEIIDGPRRTGDGYYESVIRDPQGNAIELTV